LDRRRRRALGQVEERAERAEAVGGRHQRSAVQHAAGGAELLGPVERAAHLVLRRGLDAQAEPLRERHRPDQFAHVGGIAATPGSSRPSRSSSEAPPPVDTQEMLSATPASWAARTESPPPTTVKPGQSDTERAIANVPSAKRGHSNTPIGPFQNTVRASAIRRAKSSRVLGPMSRPIQPSGSASNGTSRVSASGSNADAATTSVGSTTSKENGFSLRTSSAILPPISTSSARDPMFSSTATLSSTLAPPETSTHGRSTSPSSAPRLTSSARSN